MIQIFQIILESISSLIKGVDIFLQSKDLTLVAILALVAPFIVLWIKISNEKGKKAKQLLIERRQMQIAFNVNEIMEALKVESKWSLQEIGSTHMGPVVLKRHALLLLAATIRRRKVFMGFLAGKKKWLAFLIAILLNGLNDVLNLNLSPQTLDYGTWLSFGYIAVEGTLDIIRSLNAYLKKNNVNPAVTTAIESAYTNFKEAIPYLKEIHSDINKLLDDVKKDDGSQAFKDAMHAYAQIKPILDAMKHPEPLAVIVEDKVAS